MEAENQEGHGDPGNENTELENVHETPTEEPSTEGELSLTAGDNNDTTEFPPDEVVTDEGGAVEEQNAEEADEVPPVAPEDVLEVAEKASEKALDEVPVEAAEKALGEVPEVAPEKALGEVPEVAPEKALEEVPEVAPEKALEEVPEVAPEKALEEVPEEVPKEVLEKFPDEVLEKDPEQVLEEILAETRGGDTATPQAAEDTVEDAPAELPTGETSDEGEGPELQLLVRELLSREGRSGDDDTHLDLGTPERDVGSPEPRETEDEKKEGGASSTGDADSDDDEDDERVQELRAETEALSQLSVRLQMKLAEYFRRKTGGDPRPEKGRAAAADQEQRYQGYMATAGDLREQIQRDVEAARLQVEELQLQIQEKLGQVECEQRSFTALKRDVAVTALSRRLGKVAAQAEVEAVQAKEQRRGEELARARLENIKLRNRTERLEAALRSRTRQARGGAEFERLRMENQAYGEKIEECNEDMMKLRKKITGAVPVLTHVKEKLQFVQTENQASRAQLAEAEAAVARRRDVLTRTKQARDGLRTDNQRLRQRCGLLGNDTLLRDLEDKMDASERLEERLEALKRRHAELSLKNAGVKRKLEQTKPATE